MQIKEKIEKWVRESLVMESVVLVHPKDIKNGDYSFFHSTARENDLGQKLLKNKIPEVEKVEVVGNFVNIFLTKDFFAESVAEIDKEKEKFGQTDLFKNQKIIIEYTDPNPFKEFHIGHLMSNSIGEAISRSIEAGKADIKRLSYGGDVGLHVAKAIYAILKQKEKIEEIKKASKKEQLKFWAESYVSGNSQYENDENIKKEIDNLNRVVFEKKDAEINQLYDWGREISIEHFQEMFKLLDTNFDKNIWESEVVSDAMEAIELGLQKNILERNEGAVIFRGENYGLHTRVFLNSKGVPTYEAKELGLGVKKYNDFSFDKSIVITGNEQNEYFKVVLKATELIKPEVAGKTVHIGHGMLRFASGKMSSRKGNVITTEFLIEQIKEEIMKKLADREYNEEQKKEIAEIVAIGAIKYSILRQAIGGDIIFDFEKSISFEGDSGPYLQYTAVRAKSVLEKALNAKLKAKSSTPDNWETTELEKLLYRFPEVVERAAKEYAPHYLVTYLTELAGSFNNFYSKERIIDPSIALGTGEDDPASSYKVALTEALYHTLKNGLRLLAIKVPERM